MTADWLDRVALATDQRITRGDALRRLGLGALALGPLGALLRASPARADTPPCRPACGEAWLARGRAASTHCLKALEVGLLGNVLAFGYAGGCTMALMYEAVVQKRRCFEPNCGGQPPPPNPPPPAPPPPPPPPPRLSPPEWERLRKERMRTRNERRRIKKKKPPPKPDPCKGCRACCPSKAYGFRCCNCCDPSGDGCGTTCG